MFYGLECGAEIVQLERALYFECSVLLGRKRGGWRDGMRVGVLERNAFLSDVDEGVRGLI